MWYFLSWWEKDETFQLARSIFTFQGEILSLTEIFPLILNFSAPQKMKLLPKFQYIIWDEKMCKQNLFTMLTYWDMQGCQTGHGRLSWHWLHYIPKMQLWMLKNCEKIFIWLKLNMFHKKPSCHEKAWHNFMLHTCTFWLVCSDVTGLARTRQKPDPNYFLQTDTMSRLL